MDSKRPRKLNLNAPLLSTRRLGYAGFAADSSCTSNPQFAFQNTSERVPFSWEEAPGKPKEANETDADHNSDAASFHDQNDDDEDDGFDGNDGDNYCDYNKDNDVFSDAMDVFSLSEALDIVQKKSENAAHRGRNKNEGLRLKLEESNGYQSPTYMINRFLPDATALAASSSALNISSSFDKRVCDTCSHNNSNECYLSGSARHSSYASCSSSSPKGYCGLEVLFPWRLKDKLCAMKSPVIPCSTNLQKHRHVSKVKNRRSSQHMPWSCTNVKGDV